MKKLLTLIMALVLMTTLVGTALAYDGEILDIVVDSDDTPFSWDPATDKMAAMIQDKFGINLLQSETNYYNNDFTVTQLAAVDGNLPDFFTADILYYPQLITQFIPEELVAEIPMELIEKYPAVKNLLENDAVAQLVKNMYDGYYFLPKPDSADPTLYLAERKGLFIRKDWLEAVGMEMPKSWEELYEVCHAFTYNDPDGNGKNDTYGLTGDGMGTLRYFFASTGSANRYWNKDAEGNWYFGASTWSTGLQKFSSNMFGVCVRNADADWVQNVVVEYYGAANPDCNPFDRVDMIPAMGTNKGDEVRMEGYISCMVANMFNPDITEEKMDRILAFYEYLITEGKYMRMGLEGEDYVINEDGSVVKVRDENGNPPVLATKYPCIPVTHFTSWGFELAAYDHVEFFDEYNAETKALNTKAREGRNNTPVYPEVGPMRSEDTAVTDTTAFAVNAEYWQIITGKEPVADMFAEMKARAMSTYYDAATEVVEEYAEKYGW